MRPHACVRCGMAGALLSAGREAIVRRWATVLAGKKQYPRVYRLLERLPLCAGCLEGLPVIGEQQCQQCGRGREIQDEAWHKNIHSPEAEAKTRAWRCRDCQRVEGGALEGNRSLLRYNEWGKDLLGTFKYRGDERLARFFGTLLMIAVLRYFPTADFTGLVAVPLHRNRLLERGFNQMELLSDTLSEETGVPVRRWLQRRKDTPKLSQQSGREARQVHMEEAFVWVGGKMESKRRPFFRSGRSAGFILLLDDIYTTGSTLRACAETIRKNQSAEVKIWSLTIYR